MKKKTITYALESFEKYLIIIIYLLNWCVYICFFFSFFNVFRLIFHLNYFLFACCLSNFCRLDGSQLFVDFCAWLFLLLYKKQQKNICMYIYLYVCIVC